MMPAAQSAEDVRLVIEALYGLQKVKQAALDTSEAAGMPFSPRDFALPQIAELIARYEHQEEAMQ